MFSIWFEFPSGKYIAARQEAPSMPEWPPHPSRSYSALVAAAYRLIRETSPRATNLPDRYRLALEWVECAGPPAIWCSDADLAEAPTSYVPVNDSKSRLTSTKKYCPNPIHALRQPRAFPSIYLLGHPAIGFGWEQLPDINMIEALSEIASRVTHLGTSHSFAVAHIKTMLLDSPPSFIPSTKGTEYLRVPVSGRLAELDQLHASAEQNPIRRPAPAFEPFIGYERPGAPIHPSSENHPEMIVFRLKGVSWYAAESASLARAVRAAVMSVLGNTAPPAVHGHSQTTTHVSWLPLPDVGHQHANGRIVGIAVLIPCSVSLHDRGLLLAALIRMPFVTVPGGHKASLSVLKPGEPIPIALRSSTWCRHSRVFESVTPIVLDRTPKHKTSNAMSVAVADSIVRAGFPAPQFVECSIHSSITGAPSSYEVKTKIPRCHARVSFNEPLSGPLIAGRLRHFGIGLFRPVNGGE